MPVPILFKARNTEYAASASPIDADDPAVIAARFCSRYPTIPVWIQGAIRISAVSLAWYATYCARNKYFEEARIISSLKDKIIELPEGTARTILEDRRNMAYHAQKSNILVGAGCFLMGLSVVLAKGLLGSVYPCLVGFSMPLLVLAVSLIVIYALFSFASDLAVCFAKDPVCDANTNLQQLFKQHLCVQKRLAAARAVSALALAVGAPLTAFGASLVGLYFHIPAMIGMAMFGCQIDQRDSHFEELNQTDWPREALSNELQEVEDALQAALRQRTWFRYLTSWLNVLKFNDIEKQIKKLQLQKLRFIEYYLSGQ